MSTESTPEPIGRFDHVGIAVHSIDKAREFYEGVLGAKCRRIGEDASGEFRVGIFDLENFCIELLEPINPDGFLAKFLAKRGEGIHHITIQTPDLQKKVINMEAQGVRVVDKHLDNPELLDAFISPKSSHGVLIQLGQTPGPLNNEPYWETEKDDS
ncbi:MAG: VOC family protein [Chromatiales bacterium]|jgi:methylmalonyl-CoA epimerase|nr:VOC family protein [Chromatiales bacterium]